MYQSNFFKYETDGNVAILTLARPEKANSMSRDFWTDLPIMVREMAQDPAIRALVIAGEGKHFSAGMDLSTFDGLSKLIKGEPGRAAYAMRKEILWLQDAFNALEEAPFPVIAAIHGACVGAGVDMTSACDIRLASEDAFFSIEEINIGMAADVGTLQRLPKLIAPGIVRELAYTGRRFGATEALQWGFVNSVHAGQAATLEAAKEMAKTIGAKTPLAITGIKRSLNHSRDHSVAEGLEFMANWNAGMLRPQDLMTAIQAKMAKQEAQFGDLPADQSDQGS